MRRATSRSSSRKAAALDWYRTGAEAGIASAQYRLGRMYAKGEGVARNDQLALQWLLQAAEQGHPEARKEAGELLNAMGRHEEASALGHEGAARQAPPPAWPQGVSTDPGPDPSRTIAVRVAGVGMAQAVAVDGSMANPYEIIRWFPETDGKPNSGSGP